MKIRQHPRMHDIMVGDEVYSTPLHIFARVIEVFPAAVCVRVGVLSLGKTMELLLSPSLWRADEIENLSVCQHCGSRDDLLPLTATGVPLRVCVTCSSQLPGKGVHHAGMVY